MSNLLMLHPLLSLTPETNSLAIGLLLMKPIIRIGLLINIKFYASAGHVQ